MKKIIAGVICSFLALSTSAVVLAEQLPAVKSGVRLAVP